MGTGNAPGEQRGTGRKVRGTSRARPPTVLHPSPLLPPRPAWPGTQLTDLLSSGSRAGATVPAMAPTGEGVFWVRNASLLTADAWAEMSFFPRQMLSPQLGRR